MRALLPSAKRRQLAQHEPDEGAGESGDRQQRPPVEQPHAVPDHAAGEERQRLREFRRQCRTAAPARPRARSTRRRSDRPSPTRRARARCAAAARQRAAKARAARRCRSPRRPASARPSGDSCGLRCSEHPTPLGRSAGIWPSDGMQLYTAGLWEKPCALARASMQDLRKFELNSAPKRAASPMRRTAQKGAHLCAPFVNLITVSSDQRLENWNERRALARPYFLRSTTRESRVRKPPFLSAPRRSGS